MKRLLLPFVAVIAIAASGIVIVDVFTQPDGEVVAVIGDSITAIGTQQLQSSAGGGFKVEVQGTFGAKIEQQQAAATALAEKDPTQVIINLGTNDLLQGTAIEDAAASLERMASTFPNAKCIHFVTINANLDQDGNRPQKEARALNELIMDLARRLDRGVVVRWDALNSDAIDDAHPLGLTDDGVHPNPAGQKVLADAEVDALNRCGRPWHFW